MKNLHSQRQSSVGDLKWRQSFSGEYGLDLVERPTVLLCHRGMTPASPMIHYLMEAAAIDAHDGVYTLSAFGVVATTAADADAAA
jgi:hypothetical protein